MRTTPLFLMSKTVRLSLVAYARALHHGEQISTPALSSAALQCMLRSMEAFQLSRKIPFFEYSILRFPQKNGANGRKSLLLGSNGPILAENGNLKKEMRRVTRHKPGLSVERALPVVCGHSLKVARAPRPEP